MPERQRTLTSVIETLPRGLVLVTRLGLVGIVGYYVATEPSHAEVPPAAWTRPVGFAIVGVLLVLAVASWALPRRRHAALAAVAVATFLLVDVLILIFAFDPTQSLFLLVVLLILEPAQYLPKAWGIPLAASAVITSAIATYVIGPTVGVDPHAADVLVRGMLCFGLLLAIEAFFRIARDEQRAIHASEEVFRTIFSHAPVGMALADVDGGRLIKVNEAYVELLGSSEEELLGAEISAFTVVEDFELQHERMAAVVRGEGEGYRMRKRYRRSDGALVTADVATSLVRDASGAPSYWIAQVSDVTAQLEEEERRREAELRYRALVENFPDGVVFVFDQDHRLLLMEGRELESLGVAPSDDRPGDATLPDSLRGPMRRLVTQALEGLDAEGQLVTGDRTFELRAVPTSSAGGSTQVMVVALDVTAHKDLEERLVHSNTELQHAISEMQLRTMEARTLSEMGDLLAACVDEEEAHDVLARTVPRLFPRTTGAVYVMRSSRNLLEVAASWGPLPPDESSFAPEECWALRRGRPHAVDDASREVSCRHVTAVDSTSSTCVPMLAHGETLGVLHLRSHTASADEKAGLAELIRSVAEQISLSLANFRLRETLRMQSIQDPLTGLYNRRFMQEFLERQLQRARRHDQSLAVLMIDVDHLKSTNDTFGHEAGDELIKDVARVLTGTIRGGDIACRYGGDEFAIIATDADLEDAEMLAARLRTVFRELAPGVGLDPQHRPDLSIGVSAAPDHGWEAEQLIRLADEALYRAKAEGRGRVAGAAEAA